MAGPGLRELAAAESLAEHRPLVLGDGPRDLEQPLVVRAVGDRPRNELDVAAGPTTLLQQTDLIRVAAGPTAGAVDRDGVALALALPRGVAEPVACGAVEPRPGVPFIDKDVFALQLMAVGRGPAAEGVEWAVDRRVTPLFLGRDPGLNGGSHDPIPPPKSWGAARPGVGTEQHLAGLLEPPGAVAARDEGGVDGPPRGTGLAGSPAPRFDLLLGGQDGRGGPAGLRSTGRARGVGTGRGPVRNHKGRPQFVDCVRMVHLRPRCSRR